MNQKREGFLRQAQDKFRGKPAAQRGLETKSPTRSAAKGHAQKDFKKILFFLNIPLSLQLLLLPSHHEP